VKNESLKELLERQGKKKKKSLLIRNSSLYLGTKLDTRLITDIQSDNNIIGFYFTKVQ